MIFILGGNGFVGQAYPRLLAAAGISHVVISRDNYDQYVGQPCDILINANGNSKKFMSDRDPLWDFDASVRSVAKSLINFPADRYVFLSSGDVYPAQDNPEITREDDPLDPTRMSRYGLHKYLAETLVRSTHKAPLVIRMGGFVGPGLLKNAIFDMLNDQPVWLDANSELQFIATDTAARIVWSLVESGVVGETINIGGRGVIRIGDVFDRLQPQSTFVDTPRKVRFELSTAKLESLYHGVIPTSAEDVSDFLTSQGR